MEQLIMPLAGIGLLLSLYTLKVEHKIATKPRAAAVCDISDHVSCTRAFTSEYGKTFGVSNGAWGLIYYLVVLSVATAGFGMILPWLTGAAVLGSCYFAYNLYFKLKDFCVVCTSVYIVNILLFLVQFL